MARVTEMLTTFPVQLHHVINVPVVCSNLCLTMAPIHSYFILLIRYQETRHPDLVTIVLDLEIKIEAFQSAPGLL